MNRVIKFRAWAIQQKEMSQPFTVFDLVRQSKLPMWFPGTIETNNAMMQFTGLSDKNGKDIYEGDVCQWGKYKSVIFWEDNGFWFQAKGEDKIMPLSSNMEVIGNIYQDEGLLKTK